VGGSTGEETTKKKENGKGKEQKTEKKASRERNKEQKESRKGTPTMRKN
jgi:hypothetical protein